MEYKWKLYYFRGIIEILKYRENDIVLYINGIMIWEVTKEYNKIIR